MSGEGKESSMKNDGGRLISVHPDVLKFVVELKRQSFCDLKVVNNSKHHVAFKVKTSAPRKYRVRPNAGGINAGDSCVIRVTAQAIGEYSPSIECKDKFLLLSTIVPPNSDVRELPKDTFAKESGRTIEECKLRVVYITPGAARLLSALQHLEEERDSAVKQIKELQQELDILKRLQKSREGFGKRLVSWWSAIRKAGCCNRLASVHPN